MLNAALVIAKNSKITIKISIRRKAEIKIIICKLLKTPTFINAENPINNIASKKVIKIEIPNTLNIKEPKPLNLGIK